MSISISICQQPPVWQDLSASIQKALELIESCAANGAHIIVFPEAWLPGYPSWIWRLRPGGDMALGTELHEQLRHNAVDLNSDILKPLYDAAAKHEVVIAIGCTELDSEFSGSTLYCSMLIIDADGTLAHKHRKLLPTNPERMVWGRGDGSGLKVVATRYGRIASLICWESYMPLARFTLYAQAPDIYLAPTWDSGAGWKSAMEFIARESGCWVMSSATAVQASDLPSSLPGRDQLFPDKDEWINPGDAMVLQPNGKLFAGPLHKEKHTLSCKIDLQAAASARKSLDVTGHYNRPDLFNLTVDRRVQPPITFKDTEHK